MKRIVCAAIAVASLSVVSSPAFATSVTFNLGTQVISWSPGDNTPFSTSLPSVGTLTFTDVSAGIVDLVIQAGLVGDEYFKTLLFNGSTGNPSGARNQDLTFVERSTVGSFADVDLTKSNNAMTLNPPGNFDFKVDFNASTFGSLFNATDSITYRITCGNASSCGAAGFNPLDALDFNVANAGNSNSNYNGWFAAVELGYVSGWDLVFGGDNNGARYGDRTGADNVAQAAVATPEPGSMILLGTGVAALIARRRKAAQARVA
jgi:hypothetical protein